jgi:hypothetical protein
MASLHNISGTPYKTAPSPSYGGKKRRYYIAAEVVEWDYAPYNGDLCPNAAAVTPFTPDQEVFTLGNKVDRIGHKYLKAQYIEYTDSSFKWKKYRSSQEAHLGIQGPLMYAEVGDMIQVLTRPSSVAFLPDRTLVISKVAAVQLTSGVYQCTRAAHLVCTSVPVQPN